MKGNKEGCEALTAAPGVHEERQDMTRMHRLSQMDSMAFIGFPIAEQYFGFDGHPTGLPAQHAWRCPE